MTAGERRPQRFGALIDAALAAWAERWPFYLGLAGASVLLQLGLVVLFHFDALALVLVNAVVDGFLVAVVSIDVSMRVREEPIAPLVLLRAAALRWPVVTVVELLVTFIQISSFRAVFGNPDETLYGLLILPGLAVNGVVALATVVASIDASVPPYALPFYALMRSVFIAGGWPNLGRLTAGGAMLAVPTMLQQLLEHWLNAQRIAPGPASFWANVPLDALVLAPFQAFFTYLYLDFVVREVKR